jgi:hypothetical protein
MNYADSAGQSWSGRAFEPNAFAADDGSTPPAFAEAILDVMDHPERFAAGVQQGRQWVEEHRTYPAIAADVMAVYRRFLVGPR